MRKSFNLMSPVALIAIWFPILVIFVVGDCAQKIDQTANDAWRMACFNQTRVTHLTDKLTTSIIIVTHNENHKILLKTISSLTDNTPAQLIKEIIVVDDFSSPPIRLNTSSPTLKIIRNKAREGLIRSRLIGAHAAIGHILVFSDSHIVFMPQWLEPILYRLMEENDSQPLLLSPSIDAVSLNGVIHRAPDYLRGGFEWDFTFVWEAMDEAEKVPNWRYIPRSTPAIAGSVIALRQNTFFEMGAFDAGMDIWGGENIEISIRWWLCGGRVEILPCSHVAHLFRNHHGYSFPNGQLETISKNAKRAAKVWLQPSKQVLVHGRNVSPLAVFYSAWPEVLRIPARDLSERLLIRKALDKCKDFAWFIEKVYPRLLEKAQSVRILDFAVITTQPELFSL